jgi:hypothetical protein
MRILLLAVLTCSFSVGSAHNSYTGNYSGAPGALTCASSCHGSSGGTLVVTGFPTAYVPGQSYQIVVKHNGGSSIVNFNATTRMGTSTTVAGTFATISNCALYSGSDGGVFASPHAIDSAVFKWTAPAKGSGSVAMYAAGFQGTTSSKNGQSSTVTATSSEVTTGVTLAEELPAIFVVSQNYPNPFNPTTVVSYQLPVGGRVRLVVYDPLGREVATLADGWQSSGEHSVSFDGSGLASGVYLYRLTAGDRTTTRKMILAK